MLVTHTALGLHPTFAAAWSCPTRALVVKRGRHGRERQAPNFLPLGLGLLASQYSPVVFINNFRAVRVTRRGRQRF